MNIIFELSQWILPKFALIQDLVMTISRLTFGGLDLVFKVTLEKKLLNLGQKYVHAHSLPIGSVDFAQIRMNLIHGHDKKLIKIWGP